MAELKPCPFCGATPIFEKGREFTGKNIYQVYCPSAYVRVSTMWMNSEQEAIEAWNRRAGDEQ